MIIPCVGQTPEFKHDGDAGADVRANEDVTIYPGEYASVKTGLRIALPKGYVALLFARSGNGRRGIGITHGVGVIDAGYRGEIKVCLYNADLDRKFQVKQGDRIAQLVIMPVPSVTYARTDKESFIKLCDTERGTDGFGSTGNA